MASKSTTAPRTAAPSQPSSASITLDAVRSRLLAGQSVSPGEFASAKASVEMDEMIADLAGQRQAAAEAAELDRRRAEFTDQILSDPLLATGADRVITARLQDAVRDAIGQFIVEVDRRDKAIFTATAQTRNLGMTEPDLPVRYVSGAPFAGL